MSIYRPVTFLVFGFLGLILGGFAPAVPVEQLAGLISSVNVDGKKIVVTPTGKESTVDVTVNDQTVIQTEAGKSIGLKDLKPGDGLGIVHANGLASKILVAASLRS